MIYNTRNSKRNKRGRPENFDLNRSTYFPEQSKQRRIGSDEMANEDRNMSALQFIDLADTIMRRDQNTNHVPTVSDNLNNNGPTTSDLHGLVQDEAASVQKSLEDKVKKMVETEISDVKKMIDSLSKGMRELSDTVRKQLIVPPTATVASNSITNSNANPTSNNNNDAVNRNMPPIIQFPSASQTPLSDQFTGPITNTFRVEPLGIRVDKLGLNFSGDPKGLRVMDFIKRLEIMQAQYNIPWSEVLRDFAFLVSGQAREWYWLHRQSNVYTDWVGLKEALISQYQTPQSKFDILRDLLERKQRPNESINSYFHEMGILRSRLLQPIYEYEMIKILRGNIREDIKRHVYQMTISSVEQLRIECIEAERNFPRRENRAVTFPQRPIRQVNEIYDEIYEKPVEVPEENIGEELSAIRIQSQIRVPIICWNCREKGHVFMDCPVEVRKLFCYRCGKPDTVTPKCPVCQQGNSRRGVEVTGETHPSENPVNRKN